MDNIYKTTTASTSVAANDVIPLTTVTRRKGCSVLSTTNGILLTKTGYYKISGTVTVTAPVAGTVVINAQKTGTDITGITATETITTATTETRTIPIEGIVRVWCGEGQTILTLFNAGVAVTVLNASVTVMYLS